MAELTLGQILDMAIGAPKTEPIDFEQLRKLLNGMLVHFGLQDLPVQESGEPLEGTPKMPSPADIAADIEQLKQRTEDNEREIREVRAICEELRVEIQEIKEEQSHMAEEMEKMQESPDMPNIQDMLDNLRNELLDTVKDMMSQGGQVSPDLQQGPGMHPPLWEDRGLIVIGSEITLTERSRSSPLRQRDTLASSSVSSKSKARAQSRGHLLPGVTSSPRASLTARGTGWNDVEHTNHEEIKMGMSKGAALPSPKAWDRGKNLLHRTVSSPRASFMESDRGWNDMGQIKDKEVKTGISKGAALPSTRAQSRDKNLLHGVMSSPRISFVESGVEWSDVEQIEAEEIRTGISKAEALLSPLGAPPEMSDMEETKDKETEMSISKAEAPLSPLDASLQMDMEQIEDEEIKVSIKKAEALPSPLGAPPAISDMEEIKDKETEMRISKAPPHVQTKSLDGSVAALGVHPQPPSTHTPIQQVKSVQGHPASQTLWIPAESVPGTDSRFPMAKEAGGGGSCRMDPSQIEPGMKLLKVPSPDYLPSDQQFPGLHSPPGSPALSRHSPPGPPLLSGYSPPSPGSPALPRRSDIVSYTPPPSPALTGHLPHTDKLHQEHPRWQAGEGYSRRSPRYCGGQHTSICPVQPMEPLLPDPSKPGVFNLVGRDGFIYRGRQSRAPTASWVEGASHSKLQ